ncbi:MAG TPA: carboxypeptidase-like regulatory domain-containing protein, partial [Chitinophagaceae bacterium]|nr:carboxypeptidase-like regulatory domain-containing protein [Chitinophagaceae bacterium]
ITDCDNQPVANAVVTVERCKDKKLFSTVTNSKGQASFPLCKKEICKTRISQVGFNEKDIPKVGDNCNGDNCTIKICSE